MSRNSLLSSSLGSFYGPELAKKLCDSHVAIVGLGQSGISAARCLLRLGSNLFLSEAQPRKKIISFLPRILRNLPSEFGKHTARVLRQNLIVVSPGVDLQLPLLRAARKKGIPIWNELELGYRLSDFKKIVAVTGTNGKTTTVSLIGEMCRKGKKRTLVAGNIGEPVCDFAGISHRYDAAIMEVSSYQLECIDKFHTQVAVVLNLTKDHLMRHGTMERYAEAKERIFLNQTADDFAVLNAEDLWCRKMSQCCPSKIVWFSTARKLKRGVFFDREKNRIVACVDSSRRPLKFPLPAHLPGLHNVENSCASVAAALCLGVRPSAIRKSLMSFKGVPHRLEKVRVLNGVTYINDSKGTNVDSTVKALESFSQPIWLILGGQDKGSPYLPLKSLIIKKVRGIFLIGESSRKIYSELKGSCEIFFSKTLPRAVQESSRKARRGDIVLLSPACASFDQFRNFEDRGNQFKKFVKELEEVTSNQ